MAASDNQREFLFDRRVVDRHVLKGVIDSKQVEKFIAQLSNVESNAAYTHIEDEDEEEGVDE